MFRIIQNRGLTPDDPSTIPAPFFWLICDNRHCGVSARADMPVFKDGDDPNAKSLAYINEFLTTAFNNGWLQTVDGHWCPEHHQAMIDSNKRLAQQLEEARAAQKSMEQVRKEVREGEKSFTRALVQLGASDEQIKAAARFKEVQKKMQEGLMNGFTNKTGVRA